MTVISLDGITLRRGGYEILHAVSWTIRRGEHWALLGQNGSGKTTLLKVITGYEWPTEGTVEVLGRRYGECNLPELRKQIGWVSSALVHQLPEQNTALEIVLSGLEASLGVYREFTGTEIRRARATLALLGGKSFADRPYGLLSQGEQQRVLIARGLVHGPALLILDEPCAGLDPAARESFLGDLSLLVARRGAPSLVFVTHHIEEIAPWITHALVLRQGRTLAHGRTEAVLRGSVLTKALAHPCEVLRKNGRYSLSLHPRNGTVEVK